MDSSSLIQLGVGGAALFVLYQLGRLVITKWSETNAAQNKAVTEGFRSITEAHAAMIRDNLHGYNATANMLNEHHSKVSGQIGNLRDWVVAIDSKLSTALDLTPIQMQRPDLMKPVDKALVTAQEYLGTSPPPLPSSGFSDHDPTPPQTPRVFPRQPTPVPVPPPERALTPTGRAQSVPRPIGGEYSGAVKKPR